MKFNSVVTNIEQDFTPSEKALGRKNIDAGGLAKYEIDAVEQWSGDLVLGQRTGSSMREIGVKLRDAVSGDYKVGYLVPPRTFKGMNLVCDASGNITWGVQPPVLQGGNYTYIDDHYHINVSGLQEHLTFNYTEDQKISGINGSAINGAQALIYSAGDYVFIDSANVINVTGLQPSGEYALKSDLDDKLDTSAYHEYSAGQYLNLNDYVFNVTGLQPAGEYVTPADLVSATSGKLDTSAYHEYSAGTYLSLNDYVFNVTGVQEELTFDYTDAGKISAINGSAVYGSEGGATYEAGQYIDITDQNVINVTGLQPSGNYALKSDLDDKLDTSAYESPIHYTEGEHIRISDQHQISVSGTSALIAGQNISISATSSGYMISSVGGGGGDYLAGDYIYIDDNDRINVTGCLPLSAAPVQSDWTEDDNTLLSYIQHKPVEIGLIAGSGVWFEDLTSGVRINCSATGLDYAVSGISGVSGIFIEDAGDHMNIGYSGSVAGGLSAYYSSNGSDFSIDTLTFTSDNVVKRDNTTMGLLAPYTNVSGDEGKVPVVYVRDGRTYYLLERITGLLPASTSQNYTNYLTVDEHGIPGWTPSPIVMVADSGDIPASGATDGRIYVVTGTTL